MFCLNLIIHVKTQQRAWKFSTGYLLFWSIFCCICFVFVFAFGLIFGNSKWGLFVSLLLVFDWVALIMIKSGGKIFFFWWYIDWMCMFNMENRFLSFHIFICLILWLVRWVFSILKVILLSESWFDKSGWLVQVLKWVLFLFAILVSYFDCLLSGACKMGIFRQNSGSFFTSFSLVN